MLISLGRSHKNSKQRRALQLSIYQELLFGFLTVLKGIICANQNHIFESLQSMDNQYNIIGIYIIIISGGQTNPCLGRQNTSSNVFHLNMQQTREQPSGGIGGKLTTSPPQQLAPQLLFCLLLASGITKAPMCYLGSMKSFLVDWL